MELYFFPRKWTVAICWCVIIFLLGCSDKGNQDAATRTEISRQLSQSDSLLLIRPDSALRLAESALKAIEEHNYPSLKASANLLQGRAYLLLEDHKSAQKCLKNTLSNGSIKASPEIGAQAHFYLGASELRSGKYLSAIINLRKSISYEGSSENNQIFGKASEELGDLYMEINYYNTAYKYYNLAKNYYKKDGRLEAYYTVNNKMGRVYLLKDELDKSLEAFNNGLAHYSENRNKKMQSFIYQEIAKIRLLREDYSGAKEAVAHSIDLASEISELELLMPGYFILGKTHFKANEYVQAEDNLLKSLEIFQILAEENLGPELFKYLARVYEALKDPYKSIAFYKEYSKLTDTALQKQQAQRSKDILLAIKQDKSHKEILSLRKKNQIIEKYSSMRSEGLGNNRSFIILLTAFVIVFILLVALYYKRFVDKKNISQILEETVKKRTDELNQTLQKLSFHVNNTSLAVIELSSSRAITGWSVQSEKIFGWKSKEVLGRNFMDLRLFNDKDLKALKDIFSKIEKSKLNKKFILTSSFNKPGNTLFVEWNFSVSHNDAGDITSILCFANDVTYREEALLEAETANKDLDNFIYKTSHDVKGPISRIEGLINLGLIEAKEEVSRNYFQMLNKVAADFNIVLSRLFRIHGIYYHKPEPEELNLKEEMQFLLQTLEKKNALYGLKYSIEVPEDLIWNTDKLLLYIIIQNIYENALDYRTDGLSMITFSAEVQQKQLRLQIRDNGTCIPLQAADRVFDMFFQNTAQSNTAGLGLYMVKKSVEKLGGNIKLLDHKEETIFEIFLPAI